LFIAGESDMNVCAKFTVFFLILILTSLDLSAKEQRGDDLVVTFAPSVSKSPSGGLWAMLSTHTSPTLVDAPINTQVGDCKGAYAWACWFNDQSNKTFMNRKTNQRWVFLGYNKPDFITAADLNGDGKDELIADYKTNSLFGVYVIRDVGKGRPRWQKILSTSAFIAPADLNGNGKKDLIMMDIKSPLKARMDNGRWIQLLPKTPKSLDIANLDGNRKADLVFVFQNRSGLYAKFDKGRLVRLHNRTPVDYIRADIDGNNRDDIVVNFGPGIGVFVRKNTGKWAKLSPVSPTSIVPADLDGNGRDDLIFYYGTNSSYITGKNAPIRVRMDNGKWVTLLKSYATRILEVLDIDKNGQDDMVISSLNSSSLSATSTWVWMNNQKWAELATAEALGVLNGTPIPCIGGTLPLQTFFNNCGWLPFAGFTRQTYTSANLD
jgi:hypothetical protein